MSQPEKTRDSGEKPRIVIRDLKPKKDPKGGYGDPLDGGSSSSGNPSSPPPDDPYSY